jgi:hypothetical protein
MGSQVPISDAWAQVEAALPPGWWLQGIRCASTGLAPEQRSDRWIAEARGPAGECEVVDDAAPEAALAQLAKQVRNR